MVKRIWIIFMKDLRVNLKNFISVYIFVVPIIFAIAINLFTPGINDTTINLALLEGENPEQVAYFKNFAEVELFEDIDSIKNRVKSRDDIVAILPEEDKYYLMPQGNEPERVIELAKMLNAFYESDMQIENTNVEIKDFGRTVPPLKEQLVNTAMLFISILGGMLIAINIVEEKVDNTISAINLTPTDRTTFILGKSIIGLLLAIFGSLVLILITGFSNINFIQLIIVIFVSTLLSLMLGFIQGLNNNDIMNAAGSIKLLFLPLIAGVLAIELLADKWQKFFYWNPFYWAYKGNDAILSQTGSWNEILFYAGMVLLLSGIVYLFLAPKIREGLEG